jgi:hypothetical protein
MIEEARANRHGELETDWADGRQKFRLAIGQLRELQEKTDCGPMELLKRLLGGTWRLDDVRETIRLGLVGGGMASTAALKLVARYVDDAPLAESVPLAQAILSVLLFGSEEDSPGKAGRRRPTRPSPMGDSPSPPSTALAQ